MKNHFLGLAFLGIIFLVACGDGNVQEIIDPQIQLDEDTEIIDEHLANEGYTESEIGITDLGIRYIILDSGFIDSAEVKIDESDIVDYDYIGRLLDGELFDTSISEVAEGTPAFDSTRTYSPNLTVYTESGWFINNNQGFLIPGFRDGITNTFGSLAIGGRTLILIPSGFAYGTFGTTDENGDTVIPPNAVITFELIPVRVRKQ